jgi:predicted ArsR family transcriptional regulator
LRKINHIKMARTIALLNSGPITAAKLAVEAEVHLVTAQSWLRELRKQGVVRVHQWLQDSLGRDCTPVYALGKGSDCPRRRATRAEIMKRYREKKREAALEIR